MMHFRMDAPDIYRCHHNVMFNETVLTWRFSLLCLFFFSVVSREQPYGFSDDIAILMGLDPENGGNLIEVVLCKSLWCVNIFLIQSFGRRFWRSQVVQQRIYHLFGSATLVELAPLFCLGRAVFPHFLMSSSLPLSLPHILLFYIISVTHQTHAIPTCSCNLPQTIATLYGQNGADMRQDKLHCLNPLPQLSSHERPLSQTTSLAQRRCLFLLALCMESCRVLWWKRIVSGWMITTTSEAIHL